MAHAAGGSPGAPRARVWLARLRRWLRPPRRLRILRAGWVLILGTFGLGFATLNTGNNLLYLLLGALLGLIGVSGWLSEQALRGLAIRRQLPRAVTAGEPARLRYRVTNGKRRLASAGIELREAALEEVALIPFVGPGEDAEARVTHAWPCRGVVMLDRLVVATSFPFGLFAKERDLHVPGTLVVWPRTDRPVRAPAGVAERGSRARPALARAAAVARGEFRGLRPYRPGDDPRDIHWATSARAGEPMVRESEPEGGEGRWIVLDTAAPAGEAAEAAVEIAAALAAAATARGERFGLAAGGARLEPGHGPGQLERALDVLARVRFQADGAPPAPPAAADRCLFVSATPGAPGAWADRFAP